MSEDAMEWHPTTPPRPFDPYGDGYTPGAWPADSPTLTTNTFARPADPGFFLPAAKRICRGVAYIVSYAVGKPSYLIARKVRSQQIARRNDARRPNPGALLRDSPFRRAIAYKERADWNTLGTTPNPFKTIDENGVAVAAAAPQPPLTSGLAGFKRPRRNVRWTPPPGPPVIPESSELFYGMPTFDPPRQDTPRATSPPSDPDTPPSRHNLNLFDAPFPNLKPHGVRRRKQLPTPPDSPSTQLMADPQNPACDSDGSASDVSSEFSDSWLPMGMKGRRLKKGKARRRRFQVMDTVSSIATSPPTKPQSDNDEIEHPQPDDTAVEQRPSKPLRNKDIEEHNTPTCDTLANSNTPERQTPPSILETGSAPQTPEPSSAAPKLATPGSEETELSSTVPWSPRDELAYTLDDFNTPTPTKVSTPQRKAPSLPADFDKLNIKSRPVTPEKQVFASPKAVYHSGEKDVRKTRATEAKEKWEKEANEYKKLTPLDADWEARVKEAVKNGHGRLSASDFARVVPFRTTYGTDNWLNDEVINEYLNLVVAHGKKHDRAGQVPSHHAFSSFFYNKLVKEGPDSVRRWATRGKIGGKNLIQTKKVFIPINSGAHWTLAVVSGEEKTIHYYNSLPGRGRDKLENVARWVKNELGSAFKEQEWSLIEGESPIQANSDDCGVFTITSARQLMLGFTPMTYGPADIEVQRKRIVAELVNGGMMKAAGVAN